MKKETSIFKYDNEINNILEIAYGFQKSRVLLTAHELNIFSILGDISKSAKEVSEEIPANKDAVERLLNALVGMGIIDKERNRYSNTRTGYSLLIRDNPNYMACLDHISNLSKSWSDLTEAVREGKPAGIDGSTIRSEEDLNKFISAMNWRAAKIAPELVKMLNLRNVETVIDIGCGSGALGMEMLKVNPNIELTLFDYPEVMKIANKHVERKSLTGIVKSLEGDLLNDNIGSGYDLVLMSQVLHAYSIWDNLTILNKVFSAMNHGGTLVVHEYILDENRITPEYNALFSLNMLIHTSGGNVMTENDLWMLFKETLFSDFKRVDTNFGTSLLFGKR
jgi:ubiquinone/menaquinone biosynthesis C-methylase UbiE/predicted transcriptional regulator